MNPQNYMLGIRDVFSVLVPGAALLMLLDVTFARPSYGGGIEFLAFAIAAYLLGHVAFTIGALFDPWAIALIRMRLRRRRRRMSGEEASAPDRMLYQHDFAGVLKDMIIAKVSGKGESIQSDKINDIKGFWWDQLRLNCPPAVAELDRFEGIQKLFRSLFVVFLATTILHFFLSVFEIKGGSVAGTSAMVRHVEYPLYSIPSCGLCFALYVWARWRFDASIYRLALAFMISPHTIALSKTNLAYPKSAADDQLNR
jgi:hypothetical protein